MKFLLIFTGVLKGMAISTVIYWSIIAKLIDDAVERELAIKEAYSMIKIVTVNEDNIRKVILGLGLSDRNKIYEQLEFDHKRIKLE